MFKRWMHKKNWGNGLCKPHYNKEWFKKHPNYKKERYWKNHDAILAKEYEYRRKNIEKFKKYNREYYRLYQQTHKKECYIRHRKWANGNKEKLRESFRKRYANNPEKYKNYNKKYAWYKRNPERARELAKKSRAKHKEKRINNQKEWRRKNPEKAREGYRRYRIKKKGNGGYHTAEQWLEIKNSANGICRGWQRESHFVGEDNLTLDHIIPISRGGTDNPENLQPLCKPCNIRKGNR